MNQPARIAKPLPVLQRGEHLTTADIDMGDDDFVTVSVIYHVDPIDGDVDEFQAFDEFGNDVSSLLNESAADMCRDAGYKDLAGEANERSRIIAEDRAENRKESGSWMTRKVGGGH